MIKDGRKLELEGRRGRFGLEAFIPFLASFLTKRLCHMPTLFTIRRLGKVTEAIFQ